MLIDQKSTTTGHMFTWMCLRILSRARPGLRLEVKILDLHISDSFQRLAKSVVHGSFSRSYPWRAQYLASLKGGVNSGTNYVFRIEDTKEAHKM